MHNLIERHSPPSDIAYKHAFVDFIKSKTWHWFITVPIGACDHDDAVMQRLRLIEATFCGKYLVNRYHKLPDDSRFSFVVAFESETKCGTRHAHILAYIPLPTKIRISHRMLLSIFPGEFRYLWATLNRRPAQSSTDHNSAQCSAERRHDYLTELCFERANVARSIYTTKDVRLRDVPWSRFEFVTPPKSNRFTNRNLSAIRDKSRQRRKFLRDAGDPLLSRTT